MNIWFTADTHYSHKNITGPKVSQWDKGYRDFESVSDMNDAIVDSINSVVDYDDILYHLGDWSFGGKDKVEEFRNRVKCKRIRLCLGNHDYHVRNSFRHLFEKSFDFREETIDKTLVVMCHYSLRVWQHSHHGSFHLYGHSHHTLPELGRSMDVGWCRWRRPLSWDEIKQELSSRPISFLDHHNSETAQ